MNYKQTFGKSIRQAFVEFHRENPRIYAAFERMALQAIAKGKTKLSAKMIVNVIRWNEYIETNGEPYRINDAFHAYYARLFMLLHPEHMGIFELRRLRNEDTDSLLMEVDGQLRMF